MKPLTEFTRLWYAVRWEAKLEGVRLHDLRHSLAATAAGRGLSLLIIQKLLGHKDARSTLRYAHISDDVRKLAADDVGTAIAEALATEPAPMQMQIIR
jgi:integrase